MACDRHPLAVLHGGLCPACLLEAALAPPARIGGIAGAFTIHVPLGESSAASAFLVRTEEPDGRLLRLKVWRSPAPLDFLDRFHDLRQQLDDWGHPCIAVPLAAFVDGTGCPAVLTEFRQGVPIMEAVRTGALTPQQAVATLRPLMEAIRAAQARGLTHGSMVAGNVIADPGTGVAHLLDFGLATVASPMTARVAATPGDRTGLAALIRAVRACRHSPAGHVPL